VPLCGFAPPHFAVAGLCFAKPFYATAKRQLPVTLYAILQWLTKYIKSDIFWIEKEHILAKIYLNENQVTILKSLIDYAHKILMPKNAETPYSINKKIIADVFFNHLGFNSPPLGAVQLGVRGICFPAYANPSKISLQYPAACGGDFL